jgi:hypothetical protein
VIIARIPVVPSAGSVSRLGIGPVRTVSPVCDNASQRVNDAGNGYLR